MKLTNSRLGKKPVFIGLLILITLIMMTAVLKRCITIDTDDVERVGNEVVKMIDNLKNKNARLPNGLDELGTPFIGNNETYEYRGYIFYYELEKYGFKKDCHYWLYITFGPDEDYIYYSRRNYWLWNYDADKIAEKREDLFHEVFTAYKPKWECDSLCANIDSINTIYPIAPDSLIYCRQYYEDGKIAAEGWMLQDWDRESDYSDNIGIWKYYTRDGIMIEKDWGRHMVK